MVQIAVLLSRRGLQLMSGAAGEAAPRLQGLTPKVEDGRSTPPIRLVGCVLGHVLRWCSGLTAATGGHFRRRLSLAKQVAGR